MEYKLLDGYQIRVIKVGQACIVWYGAGVGQRAGCFWLSAARHVTVCGQDKVASANIWIPVSITPFPIGIDRPKLKHCLFQWLF
jgi:hypothetical protein